MWNKLNGGLYVKLKWVTPSRHITDAEMAESADMKNSLVLSWGFSGGWNTIAEQFILQQ